MAKGRVKTLYVSVVFSALLLQFPALAQLERAKIIRSDSVSLTQTEANQTQPVEAKKSVVSTKESLQQLQAALSSGVKPVFAEQLAQIYADRQMQLIWQDETAIQQFQQQLAELALAGFQPQFGEWLVALENNQLNELGRDALLSDAMLGYLHYLSGVKQNGEYWLYRKQPYKISAPTDAQIKPWLTAVKEGHLSEWVNSLTPAHPLYQPMHKALLEQLADEREWPVLTSTSTLKPGQSSDDVIALREILTRYNLLSASQPSSMVAVKADTDAIGNDVINTSEAANSPSSKEANRYDPELVAAVKKFQTMFGLEPDGLIGRGTKVWLNTTPQQKAGLMALNIQRLRIIPASEGTGILVNIPAFTLDFYLNDQSILSSKVIVGRPDRKTPIMSSALNNVVINPPWNVPTSMTRKDIAPRGKQDPSYFSRRGYTVYSGWGNDASVIDPYSINWDEITPSNFPYRIRQAPGPTNSLGRYKFNMPSSDAIYLHDTPNHSLFNLNARAISSGCVRVNKASELASILLGDAGWDQQRIDGKLKQGDTGYVNIPDRIPVYLYYQTAWVEGEQPQYRADIYQYDTSIGAAEKYLPAIKMALH
ncbi:L,D-transpeptidase [Moellerella wisconsensis]|uniref:L,D-transpeptidase n=1 Tax=Moellerella wisconsensis ATCC 35017 TaxID=1354267 RepID=A0A0N0I9B2_9GAMM|nr:L,D-transpeptidase [Moellerella wisconsensis]KPD01900.1 L,D-transpeptidase [Moellerella wisconsensis ATCC 35017]VFS54099.1 murein L,D-transpeptidase [Moellerella wisconsensis]